MKMRMKLSLLSFLSLIIVLISCKKDEDPEPTTGTLTGTVTDAANASTLSDVLVVVFDANTNSPTGSSVTTDSEGDYSVELEPGSYFVKASKQGYEKSPPAAVTPISFDISVGVETTKDIEMFESSISNGGWITGKVLEGGNAVSGALVVANDGSGNGYSSVSDDEGNYSIFNVPAGSYSVNAWLAGFNGNEVTASVSNGTEISGVDISGPSDATGSVTGQITFLATGNIEVDVALTHPATGETIPGLSTVTTSQQYDIANVPNGTYLARASYNNDGIVMDPDWIVKNGEPYVTVDGGAVERPFSVTNSVTVNSPSNEATSIIPVSVASTTPTFEWTSYSSASDYVIEVTDGNGTVVWGGFTGDYESKNVIIDASSTSITYGDASVTVAGPNEPLVSGKTYRWRVYASKDDNSTGGWELISVSEDQRGLFTVE